MNSNDAEIQAGEWLARLDRESPNAADLAAWNRWRAADPRHAAAFARLAATWQALDRIQAVRPAMTEAIQNDYLNPSAGRYSNRKSRRLRRGFYIAVAATLVIALGGLWIAESVGPQTYRTGIGGFQRLVLDDHSIIELNTNSEVRVALTAERRKVELMRGEASFEVAHDAVRPFIVLVGNTAVRAVGTKFDVRRLDTSVEVTVDEGKVAVGEPSLFASNGGVISSGIPQLFAGQSAVANESGVKIKTLPKGDLARRLAWQNQMLVFDGDSLVDVVAQFNRYNVRQLVIADPGLTDVRIGGYFRPTNLDAFIGVLQSDFGVHVGSEGNRLLLTKTKT